VLSIVQPSQAPRFILFNNSFSGTKAYLPQLQTS
jgi:hypothetical protein